MAIVEIKVHPAIGIARVSTNGGYVLVTGPIVGDTQFVLMKHFLQILAGLTSAEVLLDPEGHIGRGDEIRIPFAVSDAERSVDVVMMSPANPFVEVRIQTPAGLILRPGAGIVDHVLGDPGIELDTTIDGAGAEFGGDAAAWAEIGRPDGRTDRADLVELAPGVFRGHAEANATGLHRVLVRVAGRTPHGGRVGGRA